jgi:N-acetylmuramoyl-L-alanine amidase
MIALLAVAACSRGSAGDHITVFYTKDDGTTEVPWTVSIRPGAGLQTTLSYAATQAVIGPPAGVSAVRFPPGTRVLSSSVNDSTATVDLSNEVKNQTGDVMGESASFKSLVWTLTALPGIDAVAVRVGGQTVHTLPGGHLELDEPLRRSDW